MCLIAFLLHIPHTFEWVIYSKWDEDANRTYYTYTYNTAVQNRPVYRYVWPWAKEIIGKFIPVAVVILLNPLIIRAHRRSLARRAELRGKETREERSSKREERRLTLLLLTVSAVFLVCTVPSAAYIIVRYTASVSHHATHGYWVFRYVAKLLEIVNFAVNFYAYSLASSDFRHSFREVFYCCFSNNRVGVEDSASYATNSVRMAQRTGN